MLTSKVVRIKVPPNYRGQRHYSQDIIPVPKTESPFKGNRVKASDSYQKLADALETKVVLWKTKIWGYDVVFQFAHKLHDTNIANVDFAKTAVVRTRKLINPKITVTGTTEDQQKSFELFLSANSEGKFMPINVNGKLLPLPSLNTYLALKWTVGGSHSRIDGEGVDGSKSKVTRETSFDANLMNPLDFSFNLAETRLNMRDGEGTKRAIKVGFPSYEQWKSVDFSSEYFKDLMSKFSFKDLIKGIYEVSIAEAPDKNLRLSYQEEQSTGLELYDRFKKKNQEKVSMLWVEHSMLPGADHGLDPVEVMKYLDTLYNRDPALKGAMVQRNEKQKTNHKFPLTFEQLTEPPKEPLSQTVSKETQRVVDGIVEDVSDNVSQKVKAKLEEGHKGVEEIVEGLDKLGEIHDRVAQVGVETVISGLEMGKKVITKGVELSSKVVEMSKTGIEKGQEGLKIAREGINTAKVKVGQVWRGTGSTSQGSLGESQEVQETLTSGKKEPKVETTEKEKSPTLSEGSEQTTPRKNSVRDSYTPKGPQQSNGPGNNNGVK